MKLGQRLDRRERLPEVMDQPGLDSVRHHAALRGLARINRLSRSADIFWPHLAALSTQRPTRVLDLASGGGDVTLAIWRRARRAGLPLHIDGCDVSPTAIAFAAQRGVEVGADVQFFQLDLLNEVWPTGYDAIICSLFLHHLSDEEAIDLLRRAGQAARQLVLINDLVRCRTGWMLAHVAGRVLTTSDVVRIDGPLSVRAAFTRAEAAQLAQRAGLDGTTILPRWPRRFLLRWHRPSQRGVVS
jgi:SAM-dependent methyltransferase